MMSDHRSPFLPSAADTARAHRPARRIAMMRRIGDVLAVGAELAAVVVIVAALAILAIGAAP